MNLSVSVVIPTYNRGSQILNTLAALSQQSIPREEMEVIIVDDGSSDSTQAEIEQYLQKNPHPQWMYLRHSENKGKACACNTAIRAATAPLVVFTDDDCVPSPNWLEVHIKRHEMEDAPISVLGSVSFPPEWIRRSNFIRYTNSKYIGNRSFRALGCNPNDLSPRYFGGLNISIPRDQLLRVGLFEEQMGRGQDSELGYRLWKSGVKLVYEPEASIIHYEPEARSVRERIVKSAMVYQNSVPLLKEIHPEFIDEFGNWFLEPPIFGSEHFKRTAVKLLVRLLINQSIGNFLLNLLERTDHNSLFYCPLIYQYVFASACIVSVNQRQI